MDSDYLFGNCLQLPAFRSNHPILGVGLIGDLLVEVAEFGAAGKYPLGSAMAKDLRTVMTFIEHCR